MARRRPIRQAPPSIDLSAIKGVRAAPFPGFVPLCHPTLRSTVPEGGDWLYEVKLDGYRVQLHRHERKPQASRATGSTGRLNSGRFAPRSLISPRAASSWMAKPWCPAPTACRTSAPCAGRSRANRSGVYYAFDLLHLDGFDLRGARLDERRRVLQQLIAATRGDGRIQRSETISDIPGVELLRHACAIGLDGIVAKRAGAPYRGDRCDSWIKVRCVKHEHLTVIGYVPARGKSLAAIRLGRREGGRLVYVGKAGTGFTERTAQTVRQRLEPLIRRTPPVPKLRKKDTSGSSRS